MFVGNVPSGIISAQLRPYFAPYGQVESAYVKELPRGRAPTTYGFVRFVDIESVSRVLNRSQDIIIGNSVLVIRSRDVRSGYYDSPQSPTSIGGASSITPPPESLVNDALSVISLHHQQQQQQNLVGSNPSAISPSPPPSATSSTGTEENSTPVPQFITPAPGPIQTAVPPMELPVVSSNYTYGKVLHVFGIPFHFSAKALYESFANHGRVASSYMYTEPDMFGGRQGLVEVETNDLAKTFIEILNPLIEESAVFHICPSALPSIEMPQTENATDVDNSKSEAEKSQTPTQQKQENEIIDKKQLHVEENANDNDKERETEKEEKQKKPNRQTVQLDWSERVPEEEENRRSSSSLSASSTSKRATDSYQIHVNNIDTRIVSDRKAIIKLFDKYGKIKSAKYITRENYKTPGGRPAAFSFIEFYRKEDAARAIVDMHRKLVGQLAINVKYAENGTYRRGHQAH